MKWLAVKIETNKKYLDEIAGIFTKLGSGGAVINDPDIVLSYAKSGQWDAWEFPEEEVLENPDKPYSVTAYFPVNFELDKKMEELSMDLDFFKENNADFFYKISQSSLDEEDWAHSWKKYFKVLKIGRRTVIRPSWEDYQPQEGEIVIDLDPGMAFGTGSHATTSLALELTEKHLKENESVIDLGTGSGIISIQAAKLGAKEVFAFDYDPVAVDAAIRNVKDNGLADKIGVRQNDLLTGVEDKADFIIANIVADVIIRLIPQIDEHLLPGGRFVLSGIIEKRVAEIEEELIREGYEIFEKNEKEGWYGLAVKRI